jgi:hypothetical protein
LGTLAVVADLVALLVVLVEVSDSVVVVVELLEVVALLEVVVDASVDVPEPDEAMLN